MDYLFVEEEIWIGFSYDFFLRFGLMVIDYWMVGVGMLIRGFGNNVYLFEVVLEIWYYINFCFKKNNYYVGLRYILGINEFVYFFYGFRLGFNRFLNEYIVFNVRAIYFVWL